MEPAQAGVTPQLGAEVAVEEHWRLEEVKARLEPVLVGVCSLVAP